MAEAAGARFELLRTRIEADLSLPAVILVTSASAGDGKTLTARGLARCFSETGIRVALVDAGAESFRRSPLAEGGSDVVTLALPRDEHRANVSRAAMVRFVDEMHDRYDVTVVDGAAFTLDNSSVVLAGAVDAVLLTVRLGRIPHAGDRLMCEMLEHAKAPLLGVVAVDDDTGKERMGSRRANDQHRSAPDPIERSPFPPKAARSS